MEDLQNQNNNQITTDIRYFETDDELIQNKINEFYERILTFDGDPDKFIRIKLLRNNIVNITDTYLKKFQNDVILQDFYSKLRKAKKDATKSGKINKYSQFMGEIRVIQEFKGIREIISDKLAEKLFKQWKEWSENNA